MQGNCVPEFNLFWRLTPFPITPTLRPCLPPDQSGLWKYKAIYHQGDDRTGLWRDVVNIPVAG